MAGDETPPHSEQDLDTVSVPDRFKGPFLHAQEYVKRHFDTKVEDPRAGTISVSDERYILVRAESMSIEFFELVKALYKDRGESTARNVANGFLFDISHSLGKADANNFHKKMNVEDPIEKLSAGPIHFAYSGWAFVDIFPESSPSPDEDYFLIYDHPFSFEADAWMKKGRKSEHPVCIMNAGYSSGWCEESFGIPLVAVEIQCRARGDEHCRFIMAPPGRIQEYLDHYGSKEKGASRNGEEVSIPEFFQRKRLEEELTESAAKLLDTNEELESFAYSISHDLRAPLRAMQGFAQALRDDYGGKLDPQGVDYLERIMESSARMDHLIQDLLSYSRLSRTELELEETGVSEVLQVILKDLAIEIKDAGAKIEIVEPLPKVLANRANLHLVIGNLVSNAIKFQPPDRTPVLRIWGEESTRKMAKVYFRDNGIGIEKKYWDRITRVFEKLHLQEEYSGTGIGLAIVKKGVERMGGKMGLESVPGEGSTFWLAIPTK